jgi:hypothetical protein
MNARPKLSLKSAKVPLSVQAARHRFGWNPPAPMIVEAMEAHADERAARAHPYKTIGFAARDLHTCRMLLVKATLAFEAEDTPLTRREIAEAEWRFIAARHASFGSLVGRSGETLLSSARNSFGFLISG